MHHPPPNVFNPPGTLNNHPMAITMNQPLNPYPSTSGAVGGQTNAQQGCGAESPLNTPELMDVNQFAPNGSQVQHVPDSGPGLASHDIIGAGNDPSHAHIHHHVHQHHYHNHARNPIPSFPGYHYMVSSRVIF